MRAISIRSRTARPDFKGPTLQAGFISCDRKAGFVILRGKTRCPVPCRSRRNIPIPHGPKPGTGGKPGPGPMDFGNGKGIPLGNAPVSDADKMPGQADLLGGNGFGKDNLSPDHSLGLENFGKENAGPAFAPLDGDAVSGNQSGKPFGEPERNPMVEDGMGNLPESAETGGLFPETSGIPAGENRENTPELSEESGPGAVDETGTIPLSDGEQERTWSENAGGISALDDAGTGTWDTGTGIESYGETAGGASLGSDMSGIDGSDSGMVAETEGISGFVGNEIGALPSAPEQILMQPWMDYPGCLLLPLGRARAFLVSAAEAIQKLPEDIIRGLKREVLESRPGNCRRAT